MKNIKSELSNNHNSQLYNQLLKLDDDLSWRLWAQLDSQLYWYLNSQLKMNK
jgi:hypothetical protein